MARSSDQRRARRAWALVDHQHGVVTRAQLLDLGFTPEGVSHRLRIGRLYELHRGIYAAGRPRVDRLGELSAAILACEPSARLSHESGAELWHLRERSDRPIEITVAGTGRVRRPGLTVHRRVNPGQPRHLHRLPVGDPLSILIDLATMLDDDELTESVNEADRRGLVRTPRLRAALDRLPTRLGTGRLRRLLDAQTFSRSQTALERRFLAIVLDAQLPLPEAQRRLGRYRVDFHWPELGLVVETDSLTYHRTAAEQAIDVERDQAHTRAGLRTLRFTHSQVFNRPTYVCAVLAETLAHLAA